MSADGVEDITAVRFGPNAISKCLREVVPMTHSGSRIPQGDAGRVEEGRVSSPDGVPAHAWTVEIDVVFPSVHGSDKCLTCSAVIPADWNIEAIEDLDRSLTKWDYSITRSRLRRVDRASTGLGTADAEAPPVDVTPLYRNDLTPSQAGEEHQFRDLPPNTGHSLKDLLDVYEAQRVLPGGDSRNPRPLRWNW